MLKLKLLFEVLLLLIVVALGATFVLSNPTVVPLDFLFIEFGLPVGTIVAVTFVFSGLLGYAVRWPTTLRLRVLSNQKDKKVQKLEQELEKLKNESIKV
jgi:uncharacterized integral membrane protein